jgi:hypothetical protein
MISKETRDVKDWNKQPNYILGSNKYLYMLRTASFPVVGWVLVGMGFDMNMGAAIYAWSVTEWGWRDIKLADRTY